MIENKIEIITNPDYGINNDGMVYIVRVWVEGEIYIDYYCKTMLEAGKTALLYETFYKYFRTNRSF